MVNKILIIIFIMTSVCYAEITKFTADDVRNHGKLAEKLNSMVDEVNSSLNKKGTVSDISDVRNHVYITTNKLSSLSSKLSKVRATVGDPTGTVTDVRTKFILLMDTLDSTPQHTEIHP